MPALASAARSRLVEATTRTLTFSMRPEPTGWISPSCSARRSLAWIGERQLADLVEDQRAAVGLREEAGAARGGAGERALDVAEQLGVGEVGGQRGAVEADERLVRARRLRVEELGDELLAGAGLAAHEHGDVARGDAAGGLEQAAHRPATRR